MGDSAGYCPRCGGDARNPVPDCPTCVAADPVAANRLELAPFRGVIHITFAAKGVDDAYGWFEALCEEIANGGFLVEVASVELMDTADVVPDSPLARVIGGPA